MNGRKKYKKRKNENLKPGMRVAIFIAQVSGPLNPIFIFLLCALRVAYISTAF